MPRRSQAVFRLVSRPAEWLALRDFGPIRSADLRLGSLTVLVGPQAAGKSIFLQLLKLLVDAPHVKYEFRRAGVDWQDDFPSFMDVFFGEGMRKLHRPTTAINFRGARLDLRTFVQEAKARKGESMFFIPAQRVLALREGWPQAFTHYDPGVPFTVREFSEKLRLLMTDLGAAETLFPVPRRMKQGFRELVRESIFPGYDLKIDAQRAQKRLVLAPSEGGPALPFMVWSAGQREFVPLLLGLYHLLTSAGTPQRRGINWVVIEELEMGLHPRAISTVMLMVLELIARGYRVCISTHSPQVLDAVWALRHLKASGADPSALLRIFGAPQTRDMHSLARKAMMRTARVYYFDRGDDGIRDISDLDPDKEQAGEGGWGGLSEFSGRASDEVARAIANAHREAAP